MNKTAYPLCWPDDQQRAKSRKHGKFLGPKQQWISIHEAVKRLLYELSRLNIRDWEVIISTNAPLRVDGLPRSDREPSDPGVAVYWQKEKQQPRCIALDRYTTVADNIAGIAATLEAMRAIERHGGVGILDRVFKGFAALPATATKHWREVLGITLPNPTREHIMERFRILVQVHHPDKGGDREQFEAIVQARDAAELEVA